MRMLWPTTKSRLFINLLRSSCDRKRSEMSYNVVIVGFQPIGQTTLKATDALNVNTEEFERGIMISNDREPLKLTLNGYKNVKTFEKPKTRGDRRKKAKTKRRKS